MLLILLSERPNLAIRNVQIPSEWVLKWDGKMNAKNVYNALFAQEICSFDSLCVCWYLFVRSFASASPVLLFRVYIWLFVCLELDDISEFHCTVELKSAIIIVII